MKSIRLVLSCAVLLLAFSCKKEVKETGSAPAVKDSVASKTDRQRIISLNGGITEIIAALGHQSEIVGTDVTSVYPENIKETAKVLGHMRSISVEPLMALDPTMVMASAKDMNPDLLKKLKDAGIETKIYDQQFSVDGTKKLIAQIAQKLGATNEKQLLDKIDADLAKIKPLAHRPKILFIYARGNNLMVSGKDTPMASLIGIAGGENAISDFEGFKPLTPEALLKYNPDALLFFSDGLQASGGIEGVLKMPGVAQTNAGKNKRIIAMDGGLMSGFGPRLGEAAALLNEKIAQ